MSKQNRLAHSMPSSVASTYFREKEGGENPLTPPISLLPYCSDRGCQISGMRGGSTQQSVS